MIADEEHDLLRFAVELDRLDAVRQIMGRPWIGSLSPDCARRYPHRGAVALDEVGSAAVVRRLREEQKKYQERLRHELKGDWIEI